MEFTEFVEQTSEQRLAVYNSMTGGVLHLYSKGKLQIDKTIDFLQSFYPLTQDDPLFLVQLCVWLNARSESSDLKRIVTYLNSLSSGDGTPFIVGGSMMKPNLRLVSHVMLNKFDPKEINRLVQFRRLKWSFSKSGIPSVHFPGSFRRALENYLLSLSPTTMQKHVNKQFGRHLVSAFKTLQIVPSPEVAKVLRWKLRGSDKIEGTGNPFDGLSSKEAAEYILKNGVSFRKALSQTASPDVIILQALLEMASPNEAVVQFSLFEKSGFLSVPELSEMYYKKVSKAGRVVDRMDRISAPESEKSKLAEMRTSIRRDKVKSSGFDEEFFLDIDISHSMSRAIVFAREYAATLCDIFGAEKFRWGYFNTIGKEINTKPTSKEAALKALFGIAANGGTDCFVNYNKIQSSNRPASVYMWLTDGGHIGSAPSIATNVKTAVVVGLPGTSYDRLTGILRKAGVNVVNINPEVFKTSNLLVESLLTAVRGHTAIIDEIMDFPLPIQV